MIELHQRPQNWLTKLWNLPRVLEGTRVQRHDPCGFCQSRDAETLAAVDYWDLSENKIVKCLNCGQMQLDPMLTREQMELGCKAWYIDQQIHTDIHGQKKGFKGAFRRGVAFAVLLKKKKIFPRTMLELGAGDGYFARGLQYVFPQLKVTCVDIVPEVMDYLENHHGFSTIRAELESLNAQEHGTYDLVVARDVLEHTSQPMTVFKNIHQVLNSDGYFHMVSPNGFEDMWGFYARNQLSKKPAELLINHVSYFDPYSLKLLLKPYFDFETWCIQDLKGVLKRGVGRAVIAEVACAPSIKRSVQKTLEQETQLNQLLSITPEEVLKTPSGYAMWADFKENKRLTLNADTGVGRNIFALLRRTHQ